MLSKIIGFSIKNKLIIAILTGVLIIWGVWSAVRLPVDAVPDITNNQVQIITATPTLAAQETEQLVTYPIEQSLANLPGLEEMRSISRFGLSVVTVVFNDHVDSYFARQLIYEKLKEAEERIPKGIGQPELAPLSTGLGEIFQYVIHPKKGSENKYNATELRIMQDWIVARQLHGTPGVAEVNSFGGLLKQYEVAINPDRLNGMNVTISEIFTALEKNNANTGGAYIDKKPNAYFIRSVGMITSMDDIRNIVVKTVGGVPLLVKDLATVQTGSAIRYGAVTFNGEKEAVGGIVMMLKGANSASVVKSVKKKLATIQQSLPEDIIIEPFLDRTELVDRAINTVEKNLVEGALIVIFVLVVFMGNMRAGLIVASAIPLSLLFALGMMHVFGVSANLMSLGAIDFGLIVDGAVIIVEATLHHLSLRKTNTRLTQGEMDAEVFASASKIRNSAAFGELIILIVYIPVLALAGIEGKMFRPMAQTVSFAILGALILSLTYIPMMSAAFLPKKPLRGHTFSNRMMQALEAIYLPLLKKAVRVRTAVVTLTILALGVAALLFHRMGAEFIPQLHEGDYAFHCILPPGTSLSQSIETSMQASRILRSFPEVKMVIGKTGSAEVPTDPMPPEASDLVVMLRPQSEWTTTKDYNELADKMIKKMEQIPGVFFEFNQPIQMRFNELMTGIRQDVAVKIFGENIDSLYQLAEKVAHIVRTVNGTTAPQIEQTTGLPQITIRYDRTRMAAYGMNIDDINRTVSTAFAGQAAGVVFENERKFDLVVRLDSSYRRSIDDVSRLYLPTSDGRQVPLSQVAFVSFQEGPAQISREEGKRRIVIGFNLSGRDVESVIEEIREKLDAAAILPTGYYYSYGGTFENLQEASARLKIAIPLALGAIFLLLYLTFHSMKEALLIYTAIPMSAIGGVFALLIRDMPFSISAAVGFIALFGVAVLNGIVLISTFNQLQKEGITNIYRRVFAGTKARLRPVLMTATVASLGFFPMALSNSAGAEVQKPLATVVIGGLVSATLLTLFVLPLLYIIFSGKRGRVKRRAPGNSTALTIILTGALLLPASLITSTRAQHRIQGSSSSDPLPKLRGNRVPLGVILSEASANLQYAINDQRIQKERALAGAAGSLPKTGLFVENEDIQPGNQEGILKIGLSQSIAWPGLYRSRKQLYTEQLRYYQANTAVISAELKRAIRSVYYQLWYLLDKQKLYLQLDSIYQSLTRAALLKVKTGESPGLDSIAAIVRSREIRALLTQIFLDIDMQQQALMQLINSDSLLLPEDLALQKLPVSENEQYTSDGFYPTTTFPAPDSPTNDTALHPFLALQQQGLKIAYADKEIVRNENRPEFSGRFFSQRLYGVEDPYTGFSVTASFPLFGVAANRKKTAAAQAEASLREKQYEYDRQLFNTRKRQALKEVEKNSRLLSFYETAGIRQGQEIMNASMLAYRSGEIGFPELSQYLTQAINIRENYLESLNVYNQSVIQYLYYKDE